MASRLRLLTPALMGCAASAWSADRTQLDYQLYCQGCHTPEGAGHMGVPALWNQVGKFLQVPGGRDYLVRVPGAATSTLDDARLAAVLNWIVLRFAQDSLPPSFNPYTAAEVARFRRVPLNQVAPVRQRLLGLLPPATRSANPTEPQ